MRNKRNWGLFGLIFGLFFMAFQALQTPFSVAVPLDWPPPVYDFSKNPLTYEGVLLGRYLFYDTLLSRDGSVSCASCHLQATGFSHVDHELSHGIGDSIGKRQAPALVNLIWQPYFMWDGAVNHLDVLPLAPLSSPIEMGENLAHVVDKLNQSIVYKTLFFRAFGDSTATGQRMLLAFSQYLAQLNSFNSKYDRYQRGEVVLSPQENNGLQLFRQYCASCHTEPLFTNHKFENIGLPFDPELDDWGRQHISQNPADALKFKVPSLRNIQFTFPYMHDGRFRRLRDVLNHYSSGIVAHPTLSPTLVGGIPLSSDDKTDIISFLHTLTDTSFLFNPALGFPRRF